MFYRYYKVIIDLFQDLHYNIFKQLFNVRYIVTVRQQLKRLTDQWYEYYTRTVNTSDFRQYVTERCQQEMEEVQKDLSNDDSSRNDLYNEFEIKKLTICDVLDNDGIAKLLRRLYDLPKSKFKFECRFIKPTRFQKFDFVHLRYNSTGYGVLADVNLLKDKFVDRIEILCSQINNYYCFVEYVFYFKNKMNEDMCDNFIATIIPVMSKKDYRPFCHLDKNDKMYNYYSLVKFHNDMFPIVCQHYITEFFYSERGQGSKLPSLSFCTRPEPISIRSLVYGRFGATFYNKKENYVIDENWNNDEFILYAGNNFVPRLCVSQMISEFGNEFYFFFLGRSFLENFEYDFSKYISRKIIGYKKLSILLKYYYGLTDYHPSLNNIVNRFNEKWEMYSGYDLVDFNPEIDKCLEKYKSIFQNTYEHLKSISDLKSSQIGKFVSYSALGISVLSFLLSIILHFC